MSANAKHVSDRYNAKFVLSIPFNMDDDEDRRCYRDINMIEKDNLVRKASEQLKDYIHFSMLGRAFGME